MNRLKLKISPYHLTMFISILLFFVFLLVNLKISITVLIIFFTVTAVSPFFPSSNFFLPVISRGGSAKNAVSLTFDDGPDPHITPEILNLLYRHSVKACFFVTGKHAAENPDIINKIQKEGHEIANHSFSHDPLLMLRTSHRLLCEIKKTQSILEKSGINTIAFRPPAGITNPRLGPVLKKLGMICINWRCRAFDAGNRRIKGLSKKILKKVRNGDIILLHDILSRDTNPEALLHEIDLILSGLSCAGLKPVKLSELTGLNIMKDISSGV